MTIFHCARERASSVLSSASPSCQDCSVRPPARTQLPLHKLCSPTMQQRAAHSPDPPIKTALADHLRADKRFHARHAGQRASGVRSSSRLCSQDYPIRPPDRAHNPLAL